MNFIGSKKIETERLILRPTIERDLKTLWGILLIPEVNKYYLVCKINKEWDKELPWQMKKLSHALDSDNFQWSIILKDTNKCIGQISVQKNEDNEDISIRDIGWFIDPIYQRMGYAYEASNAILDYMFNEVKIKGIMTSVACNNFNSYHLMEKLGFKRNLDKKKINHYTFGGDAESYLYSLMSEQYNEIYKNSI